jgi:hypothetical protein
VSIFRRAPVPREPHPDPRIEAELQRVISLRKAVARKEAQLDANDRNLRRVRATMRANSGSENNGRRADEADAIRQDSAGLEAEIMALHDEIAARIGKMDDADLAWLERRSR